MTIATLLYPCLAVFAMAGGAPAAATPAASMPATSTTAIVAVSRQERDEDTATDAPRDLTQPPELADQSSDPVMAEPVELDTAPEITDASGETYDPVFANLTDQQIFDRAAAFIQGIDTMQARFTQIAPSGNVSTGLMQLSRPGRLRFEYDDPTPTLIVANQGLVYVHDTELETTDSYPVNKTPLKFLLSSEVRTDDAVLTAVNRQADSVALTLESTDTETEGQLVLEFAAPDLQLVRWAVYDPRGGVTVVELEEPETGIRIANNAFRVPEAGGSFLRDR